MNGIFEVVVHFSNFKNVDLFRQGLYYIRGSLHIEKPPEDQKHVPTGQGLPYHILTEKKVHERISSNKKIVYPSKIHDSARAFSSKTFRVQYVDQEVELEDACLFRFERKPRTESESCYLAVELMFSEYNSTDYSMRKDYPKPNNFECVSTKWFHVNNFNRGHGSGFYPCTFDDSHFCLLDIMLHFTLIDYQFRKTTYKVRPPPGSSNLAVSELVCNTFEHSLFPKNLIKRTNAYNEERVKVITDKAHLHYVSSLVSAYNSLARLSSKIFPGTMPLAVPERMLRRRGALPAAPSSPDRKSVV